MKRWYVAQTQPNREGLAQAELTNQNFTTYIPQVRRRALRRKLWTEITEPRFPGYILIHLDLAKDRWRSVNGTRGVTRLLYGETPLPLPLGYVETLLPCVELVPGGLVAGDPVRLTGEPFMGATAMFRRWADPGRARAELLLALLGGKTAVYVNAGYVERAA